MHDSSWVLAEWPWPPAMDGWMGPRAEGVLPVSIACPVVALPALAGEAGRGRWRVQCKRPGREPASLFTFQNAVKCPIAKESWRLVRPLQSSWLPAPTREKQKKPGRDPRKSKKERLQISVPGESTASWCVVPVLRPQAHIPQYR